jgi:DNA replication and repair protein RecF
LRVRALTAGSFRNLEGTSVGFAPGVNLIVGGNGEGKTSLLEAISVLANLRSFRTARWSSVPRHGHAGFALLGEIEATDGRLRLEQVVEVGPPLRRRLLVNGAPATVERYLSLCPVATLSSADSELVLGAPALRRALLDRLAFLLSPSTLGAVRRFQRTLRQRNAGLAGHASERELDAWDDQLSAAAAGLLLRRQHAVRALTEAFEEAYQLLRGSAFPALALGYRAEPWLNEPQTQAEVEESYRKRYNEGRVRDRHAGHTQEGPHRHDLCIVAGDRPAREVLSSGQVKVVAAALRLATVIHVERERGEPLPVMVDDVDAELDREVFARLTRALANERQLLLTSAHPELVAPAFPEALVLTMERGSCRPRAAGGE